jgi:hypothetical protein
LQRLWNYFSLWLSRLLVHLPSASALGSGAYRSAQEEWRADASKSARKSRSGVPDSAQRTSLEAGLASHGRQREI